MFGNGRSFMDEVEQRQRAWEELKASVPNGGFTNLFAGNEGAQAMPVQAQATGNEGGGGDMLSDIGWGPLALTFGLSMLANNNGKNNLAQLIGYGGDDTLNALKSYRKEQTLKKEKADALARDEARYRDTQAWKQKEFDADAEKTAWDQNYRMLQFQQQQEAQRQANARGWAGINAQRQAMAMAMQEKQAALAKQQKIQEYQANGGVFKNGLWGTNDEKGNFVPDTSADGPNMINQAGIPVPQLSPINLTDAEKLRNGYYSSDYVKNFVDLAPKVNDVFSLFNRNEDGSINFSDGSGINDTALVFYYMKMLDPASVVRESEFNTVAKSDSILNKLGLTWDKYIENGVILTPNQRKSIYNYVNTAYNNSKNTFDSFNQNFNDTYGSFALPNGAPLAQSLIRGAESSIGARNDDFGAVYGQGRKELMQTKQNASPMAGMQQMPFMGGDMPYIPVISGGNAPVAPSGNGRAKMKASDFYTAD